MMEEKQVYKIMQITTKSGTHYQFGCDGIEEYKSRKKAILLSENEFVDIVESCSIQKSQIESIEYYEQEVEKNVEN